jgi:hypothetical protein
MIRDPFYKDILRALSGPVDSELFEECAADILRQEFPTLVPIRGGDDAGMDGAISDGTGIAFPLISTTDENPIRNITKNINSYLSKGGTRRKAVFATSQKLTARKRRNLEKRASDLGFVLVQVYDRAAFADRLYYNPKWCSELLNLTGDPSPLSIIPPSSRPILNNTLIGRDSDIVWLKNMEGDRLIVGQPGCGKTFLLQMYAKENGGLFVVKKDCAAIAPVIRSQKPRFLIVDDAHLSMDFLTELKQMRQETHFNFEVICTCWPNYQNEISQTLNLPNSKIYLLRLLTRDEIVEVIKSAGIQGPNRLIREIVDQSLGKPGLAVTLVFLCINGDIEDVALGDALYKLVRATFEPLVGKTASTALAAFAIGGNSGMPMAVVAEFLCEPLPKVRNIITELASGGVLEEIRSINTLSVTPAALRFALVRDIFFSGPSSLDSSFLIQNAQNRDDAVMTLIGAKARGATISSELLLRYLSTVSSLDPWKAYAWMGKEEVNTVLKLHPELLISIAHAALHYSPETVIPTLLMHAVGDNRPLNSAPDHPLRVISAWVQSGRPGSDEALNRREILLREIIEGLKHSVDISVALEALSSVFSLRYEDTSSDPGSGMKFTLTHGVVTLRELKAIGNLWPHTFEEIKKISNPDWNLILGMIEHIAYPGPVLGDDWKEFYQEAKAIASRMLTDIAKVDGIGLGTIYRIKSKLMRLGVEIPISMDPNFEVLFPEREFNDWKAAEARQLEAAIKLSEVWANEIPEWVIDRIAFYEAEAQSARIDYPRLTRFVSERISELITERVKWAEAMIKAQVQPDLIVPFIRKSALNKDTGWENLITRCLEIESLRSAPITVILTIPSPPKHLLEKVLQYLEGYSSYIETLCLRNEVPEDTLVELLKHSNADVAGSAAIGEWWQIHKL